MLMTGTGEHNLPLRRETKSWPEKLFPGHAEYSKHLHNHHMVRVFLNSRRQTQLEAAENLNKQLNVQGAAVEKLYSSMTMLEQKISEAKRQKEVTSQGAHYKQW